MMEKYSSIYNNLLDYVFQNMSDSEESALEEVLDEHSNYAKMMHYFLQHCLQKRFSRTQLELDIQNNFGFYQKKFPLFFSNATIKATQNTPSSFTIFIKNFIEETKKWFTPNLPPNFKVAMMANNIQVVKPDLETITNDAVDFQLLFPLSSELSLNLYDTQTPTPIHTKKIPATTKKFILDLEEITTHPGIYYWVLESPQEGKQQGMITIGKDFDPFCD